MSRKTSKKSTHQSAAKAIDGQSNIGTKDHKILWARAAGRCAMEDCQALLTLDIKAGGHATIGEMCHIVGEKTTSPRGESELSLPERNSYSNLILLCRHHHSIIDTDTSQFTIERLHYIKDKHEMFVHNSLAAPEVNLEEEVYSEVVDKIVSVMRLEKWKRFSDAAMRALVHEDYYEARGVLNAMLLSTVFSGRFKDLEDSIKSLIKVYSDFITHHETMSEHTESGFFKPDKSYARHLNPRYQIDAMKLDIWTDESLILLCELTISINDFTKRVRLRLNPRFFLLHGKFILNDEFGIRSEGRPTLLAPTRGFVTGFKKKIAKKKRELEKL